MSSVHSSVTVRLPLSRQLEKNDCCYIEPRLTLKMNKYSVSRVN